LWLSKEPLLLRRHCGSNVTVRPDWLRTAARLLLDLMDAELFVQLRVVQVFAVEGVRTIICGCVIVGRCATMDRRAVLDVMTGTSDLAAAPVRSRAMMVGARCVTTGVIGLSCRCQVALSRCVATDPRLDDRLEAEIPSLRCHRTNGCCTVGCRTVGV